MMVMAWYRRLALGLAASLLTLAPAFAAPPEGVALSDARVRMIVPSRPAAGYFTLTNTTNKAVGLTGASSPDCGTAMLHHSVKENGVDKMTMVKSVDVPAHGTLEFAPGGYHLMCTEPSANVVVGKQMPITLHFGDGSSITGNFEIGGPTTK